MGLVGDLTAGEIIEQAVHALQELPFRNVVFMVSTIQDEHKGLGTQDVANRLWHLLQGVPYHILLEQ